MVRAKVEICEWVSLMFPDILMLSEIIKQCMFLTNNFKLLAKTITDIYKARWDVELFFKRIKQNLKIKSFVGTSKNAVLTQIWIAICAYLLLS